MKIIFIGTVKLSEAMLKKLISLDASISAVLTKKESTFNSDFTDLSVICKKTHIDCKHIDSINSQGTINLIKKISPDIIFCFGWSELIKKEILDIPTLGVVGYHPALLSSNRGRHPLIWALVLGLSETGSTFFFIDEGVDSGDILSQRKVRIDYHDNALSLYEKIINVAGQQIEDFYPLLLKGKFSRINQDESKATYWRKRTIDDGLIDWRMSSYSIYNLVRALTHPYIGAHFLYKGNKIKVWNAQEFKSDKYFGIEPGQIIKVYSDRAFLIKTGDNCIKIPKLDIDGQFYKGEYL